MYNENYYGFRLTCLRLNKYLFSDCNGCTWCFDVYWIFKFYLIFSIHTAVFLFLIFCWCYLAVLMSRQYKCLALISLFQSLVSGVILAPIDVNFLWLEYERIIAKSDNPNVMAIPVSLNSRLFCLARVSRIIAMTCHVHVSLVSILFYGLNLAHVSPRFFEWVQPFIRQCKRMPWIVLNATCREYFE